MRTTGTIKSDHGINWYYEQEGSGPDLVLIPDGLGDCTMFDKPMSLLAAEGFKVTTFDMPGLSRSREAPPETYQNITAQKLASYVIAIMDALNIDVATIWGCSSGGSTVLALVADYPTRIRNALAHEVPTYAIPPLLALLDLPDEELSNAMATNMPKTYFGDNSAAWEGLGEEALNRIWHNFSRWARGYIRSLGCSFPVDKEKLKGKPLDWSIGASTPTAGFFDNIVTAVELEIPISVIPGMHFPYVSDPEDMTKYVVEKTRKYL
ncbi:uncharacterized protein LTR77_010280 [Saxophila tyrrhenica]|uniref:AB hydrolase-1 domain-containing protein n=1 Tax=Saxophila tyrrhenica TaxID=1690608 RepID=A0AAV9NZ14_9PEZI|nr:hypothetical protein LTR77_010280 [Saxophila tyrrhenica]